MGGVVRAAPQASPRSAGRDCVSKAACASLPQWRVWRESVAALGVLPRCLRESGDFALQKGASRVHAAVDSECAECGPVPVCLASARCVIDVNT